MKKQSVSLIAKLLNKNSQPVQGSSRNELQATEKIIMRDVHELVPNPKNEMYSLDNIEELAMMIQLTHNIEPIILTTMDDGRFMITSGHRRRLAQLYRLEQGMTDNQMVPTITREIINDFEDAITDDEMETLNIVFPNKGQRRNLTPSQEADEIALIKPIIKKLYDYQKAAGNIDGKFRPYFANILGISETSLQRKEAIRKVSDEVKVEVDAGNITATAAAELASMDTEEQNSVLEAIKDRGEDVTVQAVKEEKKKVVVSKNDFTPVVKESPTECELEDEGQTKLFGQTQKNDADKNIAAKIWLQQEIAEKLKDAEQRLSVETADKTEEECQEWQARVKVIKEVLDYLDESHCPERCKECCDDCDRPCEHSKNFQVANTMNN
ncbi:ParB/RepB/Spo0J family partition protein [Propionispira raffinosivorans]|uniref:ParB/RepB/Spo0J family partition protein n=1 Tax=Propionispira raffinosivorans TaxID=86959 RepID=UPI00036600CD|nr:ParB N-terminal domain-containing protein [Propionispira raffinosivorans]